MRKQDKTAIARLIAILENPNYELTIPDAREMPDVVFDGCVPVDEMQVRYGVAYMLGEI